MPKIKVNGTEIDAPAGKKLIETCRDHGVEIPHYCWHPGLEPAGNCRMCLVKVSNSRKLEASCMVDPVDGLEVTTEGPDVDAGRKAVMEFLLINHPLDCPICDKAGECRLQDYTFEYRHGLSRFEEEKVLKHIKDLGPTVKLWGTRCIACTRCVRFCDDIVGTGELSIVARGDHSVVDVHPEVPLDNPMSLNVVDICPVGALKDKDFLYKARVWFSDRKDTVCASCSRGCNVTATVLNNDIKRLQPRYNADVNEWWMCDAGRRNLGFVTNDRLLLQKGSVASLADALRSRKGKVALVASSGNTLEELFLVRRLAEVLDARTGFLTKTEGERWVSRSGFAIETDKTPNRKGVEALFGSVADPVAAVADADAVVVLNAIPDLAWPSDLIESARRASVLAVIDAQRSALADAAGTVLPATCWAEKDGTYINRDGRIQRIRKLVDAPGQARAETIWLQELLVALGAQKSVLSTEGVFRAAFPGLDYRTVGAAGVASQQASPALAPAGAK